MNLYEEYGKACVQFEIWQNRVNELKRLIAQEMDREAKKNVTEVPKLQEG